MTGKIPLIQDNYYQKSEPELVIIRRVGEKDNFDFTINIKKQYQSFLKAEDLFPVDNPTAIEMATIAKHGATTSRQIVENINSWLHIHLSSTESKYGIILQRLFGIKKDILGIAMVTLCRTQEIPCRLASGFLLSPGAFIFTSWAEVFLGEWLPVYDGKLGLARFVKTSDGVVEDYKPFYNVAFSFIKIVKNNKEIVFDKMNNILSVQENYFSDHLLGISGIRPADWAFLPKNIFSNMIIFRSLKGTGPAILVKVTHSDQKIEEVLTSLLQATTNQKTTLLWQNERKFNNIQGIEGALEANNFIYQAFIGTKDNKMVLALLFVPKREFKNVQEQFFHFLSSLKFI